jgi:hypothetical protein
MTKETWTRALVQLDISLATLKRVVPAEPMPRAHLCIESLHRTLGHLTSCQAAWIPILRAIAEGKSETAIPIHPNPLFSKLGFATTPWHDLLARFESERVEWKALLANVDISQPIKTPKRVYTAQNLTRRVTEHEKNHLAAHGL